MDRTETIEAHLAHLTRTVDELNEVVAAQAREIDRLTKQVAFLTDRARSAEPGDGGVILGDERPPHW